MLFLPDAKGAAGRQPQHPVPKPVSHMTREFAFTDQDFLRIRTLIHQHAGIALADSKQELVYSRLAAFARHRVEDFRRIPDAVAAR